MILEGFEIENWSCIRKVSVSNLPATGVIVLHGPNRTGKSSIVQALRACLMDYSSTSTALKLNYPRGTAEKPVVTVTFRAGGASYRVKKQFGSSKSEFATKTAAGAWKVATTTAAEVHERTCGYAGGDDSRKGLNQLLWLTQAEFQLPDARKFDAGIQAQFRNILGVLQTPLDDRFIERIKKRWNVWFSGQRKPGKQHEIKDGCALAQRLAALETVQNELNESENRFSEVEGLLKRASGLEHDKIELERQLQEQSSQLRDRREEKLRSQARIAARQQAERDHTAAQKELTDALAEESQRAAVANRLIEYQNAIAPAQESVEANARNVKSLEAKKTEQRKDIGRRHDLRRELQKRANRVAACLKALDLADKLASAQQNFEEADAVVKEIARIEKYFIDHPTPDDETFKKLKSNRNRVAQLQADRDAASMNLTLTPESGSQLVQLALDGERLREVRLTSAPAVHAVRRKAELVIHGWGRVELSRTTGKGDLDEIEEKIGMLEDEFSSSIAPFGIVGSDPTALDQLIERQAEHRLKTTELEKQKKKLKTLAPQGLEPLQAKVREWQTKLQNIPAAETADSEPLPAGRAELESLAADLKKETGAIDEAVDELENAVQTTETQTKTAREKETAARVWLATCKANLNSTNDDIQRLRAEAQIAERVAAANRAMEEARSQLEQTKLTNEELTINKRVEALEIAVRALESQINENTRNYDVIKGRLLESEGLHARRSSLAARADELKRVTEHEALEKDAVERLYALFEDYREKQLGTLMGPIHDRVLGWMRVLDIGNYQQMRFNDAFLPDKLMTRDGIAEFALDEESTGAQEQIGMLVRLALGSTLSSTNEPAIAILDDPLTHCDAGRLNKMRVILRRAAEGDPNLTPPAGPLQIVILTCHPEWFRDERATVIDLENPEIMSRYPY